MIIKPASVKANYILNLIRLLLNIGVLVLTMPYISRVLGSEGIGKVEYAYAYIEYFIIFSALGIPVYGIRQIAKSRDDIKERSRVVIELSLILAISTILSYLIIFLFSGFFPSIEFRHLLLFLSIGVLLSNTGFEWFYQGIENQRYITIRHVFVKAAAIILLYLTVKSSADTYYYALFIIVSTFGGSIFNLFYLKNFIVINKEVLSSLNLRRHLKPSFTILLASVSVSVYMQLDKVMLGAMVSEKAVGYYAQALKLPRMMIILVTTVGAVMLPRLSHLLHNDKKDEYNAYMQKTLKYILFISVPASVLFILLSKDLILLMAGEDFLPSVVPMQIASPLICIVGIAYYIGFLVLYPMGREKVYTMAVTIAGTVNFIFNYFVIEHLQQTGASLGTLVAEMTGLGIMIFITRKHLKGIGFFSLQNLKYFIALPIIGLFAYGFSALGLQPLCNIIIVATVGMSAYVVILYVMKEPITKEIENIAKQYLSKNKDA